MQLASVLVSTAILLGAASARASSPAHPICDAEPTGSLVTEYVELAPTCAVRWVDDEVHPGGLQFDLEGADGTVKTSVVVATPAALAVPETRHECDGQITTGTRTLQEYAIAFDDAQPGDSVVVRDAAGGYLARQLLNGSACTPVDLAPLECQVCGPESSPGCADAGRGRGLATLALIALGLVLARRRR